MPSGPECRLLSELHDDDGDTWQRPWPRGCGARPRWRASGQLGRGHGGHVIAFCCDSFSGADLWPGSRCQLPVCVPADGRVAWCARVGAQPRRRQGGGRLRGTRPRRTAPPGLGAARSSPCRGDGRRRAGRAARRIEHIPDQVGSAPGARASSCATARTAPPGGSGASAPRASTAGHRRSWPRAARTHTTGSPRLPKGPAMTTRPEVVALLTDFDVECTGSGQRCRRRRCGWGRGRARRSGLGHDSLTGWCRRDRGRGCLGLVRGYRGRFHRRGVRPGFVRNGRARRGSRVGLRSRSWG